jgi:hypothetical protein
MKRMSSALLILSLTPISGCVSSVDGPALQEQPLATTSEEIVSSFSINEINPLTGCGPRDVGSAREALSNSAMQIGIDADGLSRGDLSFNTDPASAISNYIQLPLQPRGSDSGPQDIYLAPYIPVPIDYTSVEYWDKRSGLVDTSDEITRITDDLAEWASKLLSVMSINDQRWAEEAEYVRSQSELEDRYDAYRHGLTALAEKRKVISYAPAHNLVSPLPPAGSEPSSNEDLLFLSFAETELDRFGNTLAASNIEAATEYRIVRTNPAGITNPAQFVRGGRLDFADNGGGSQNVTLGLAFGEGQGGGFLDKRRFTFGASIQFEPFPTLDPLDGLSNVANDIRGNEKLIRELYRYYFDQNDILIGGRDSGWIKVGLNLRCQIEISLNSYQMDANFDSHTNILVSERVLNISQASQILFSIDTEAREVILTTGDGGQEAMVTEVFDLPDDFRFSFDTYAMMCQETESCTVDPDEIENFLFMSSEEFQGQTISPTGFRGSLDWVYLANGVLSPQDISAHIMALDLRESVQANGVDGPTFEVSPAGHVVSLALDPDEYELFLESEPTQRMMLIVQEAIVTFGDNFDVVAVVPRDSMGELAMGTDAARAYSVHRTPGTYNLDFVFPEPYAWGNPDKLRSALIGRSSAFMTTQTFLHEIAHTWGNDVVYPTGTPQYLIDGHFGFSSANGYLGGFDLSTLRSEEPGTYSAARFAPYAGLPAGGYSDIELYLMGLLPAREIEDITMFVNVSDLEDQGDRTYFRAEGSEVITINDIERLAGKRTLENDTEFEILYIVVSGETLSDAQLGDYDAQATEAARLFSAATRGLATLSFEPVGR